MNKKLPPQAYAALVALKSQAAAAGSMMTGRTPDNKRLLAEAHAQMAANQPWTTQIVRALLSGDASVNIESADDKWLESIFVGVPA